MIAPITDQPAAELVAQLSSNPAIDEGEVLLYSLLAERPFYLLASNDKRAIRAIGTDPHLADVRQAIAGRVVCLERIVRRFLDLDGAEVTARLFESVREYDMMLSVVLSPGTVGVPGQSAAALDSYLADLRHDVGDGFLYGG